VNGNKMGTDWGGRGGQKQEVVDGNNRMLKWQAIGRHLAHGFALPAGGNSTEWQVVHRKGRRMRHEIQCSKEQCALPRHHHSPARPPAACQWPAAPPWSGWWRTGGRKLRAPPRCPALRERVCTAHTAAAPSGRHALTQRNGGLLEEVQWGSKWIKAGGAKAEAKCVRSLNTGDG
jgi:hypothetical protein